MKNEFVYCRGGRKAELLGVAFNRIMRMNVENGESIKTWRFSTMKKWHVNWEIKHVLVSAIFIPFSFISLFSISKL